VPLLSFINVFSSSNTPWRTQKQKQHHQAGTGTGTGTLTGTMEWEQLHGRAQIPSHIGQAVQWNAGHLSEDSEKQL